MLELKTSSLGAYDFANSNSEKAALLRLSCVRTAQSEPPLFCYGATFRA